MDIPLAKRDTAKPSSSSRSAGRNIAPRNSSMLFHADASDPNMRYFSKFNALDPYLAFTVGNKKFGVSPIHELGRMISESDFDEVLALPDLQQKAIQRFGLKKDARPDKSHLVILLAEQYQIRSFRVGHSFPAGLLVALQEAGIQVHVDRQPDMFPERQIKSPQEIEAIRKGNRASAAGFRVVTKTLAESKIQKGLLYHQGTVLTSERLRDLINHACLEAGASAIHTIAAAGDQACDNHCVGHGPIRANELIIVDIFPQRIEDGYWGDMTRTYLKGKASDAQRRLVRTVKRAHELSLKMIKPGISGGKVHRAVDEFFVKQGYETCKSGTKPTGFFHALGHGLGLEIHEEPIMRATAKSRLRKNMVVTVEPGLYYHGLGGVRIEDVIQLVPGGNRKISSAPYKWEIA